MRMLQTLAFVTWLLIGICSETLAFFPVSPRYFRTCLRTRRPISRQQQHNVPSGGRIVLRAGTSSSVTESLTESEQTVYNFLQEMHETQYPFRLVVIGNGAILETTSPLGPTFKLNKSPKTGEFLTTFASQDQSFEFHLKIATVSKVVMVTKPNPDGDLMQIVRFMTTQGSPMCSLILADKSDRAQAWFQDMFDKYNGEIQL